MEGKRAVVIGRRNRSAFKGECSIIVRGRNRAAFKRKRAIVIRRGDGTALDEMGNVRSTTLRNTSAHREH